MPDNVTAIDTEGYYADDFSVKDLGAWAYTRGGKFDCYLMSVTNGKDTWVGHPRDFNFNSLDGSTLISHNAGFDEEVYLAERERGNWPEIKYKEWMCTADMSAYLFAVRSLKDAARVGLGVEVSKGVRDRAKGKTWGDMVAENWADQMISYAAEDAVHCWNLWDRYAHKWPDFERRLSIITREQGRHGVAIDVPKLEEGMVLMQRVIIQATESLPWIRRGRKPASPIGLYEECRSVGIPCPPVKIHNPEAAAEWEEEWAPKHKFVMALRNLRKAKKALATLETMKLRLRPDNTMAFSLKYAGASTLRWAGDGGLNFQNFAKEPIFCSAASEIIYDAKELVSAFRKEEPMPSGVCYLDMRGMIIARPRMVLAPVDESQIEPRALNWLAGNLKLLELVAQGYSIYEAYARDRMGYMGPSIKENDPNLYNLLKVLVLGCGYGAGYEKVIVIAKMYGVDLTAKDDEYAIKASVDGIIHLRHKEGDKYTYITAPAESGVPVFEFGEYVGNPALAERVVFIRKLRYVNRQPKEVIVAQPVYGQQARATVKQFRDDNPLIVALWKHMQTQLENAVGGDLVVEGPHGGCLTYREVRKEARKFKDADTGEMYSKAVLTASVGGKRSIFNGPKLVENLTQWVARMVFAEGLVRSQEAELRTLFTVHDEAVAEIDERCARETPEETKKVIEGYFSVTPAWMVGCPIAAECKLTFKYKK